MMITYSDLVQTGIFIAALLFTYRVAFLNIRYSNKAESQVGPSFTEQVRMCSGTVKVYFVSLYSVYKQPVR